MIDIVLTCIFLSKKKKAHAFTGIVSEMLLHLYLDFVHFHRKNQKKIILIYLTYLDPT